jgi:hypothetical protein
MGGYILTRDNHQGASNNKGSMAKNPSSKKEEISLELAELGNLKPKLGKMTPNRREKSEEEKSY